MLYLALGERSRGCELGTFVVSSQAVPNFVTYYKPGPYTSLDLLRVGILLTVVFLFVLELKVLLWQCR